MNRIVQDELLDTLAPADQRAIHSRRDLRRLNCWMRHPAIMADVMQRIVGHQTPGQLTELGAGDGTFLLSVARRLAPHWRGVSATLLDRHENVTPETLADFATLGWRTKAVTTDVFAWPETPEAVVVANLFLHHFEPAPLAELLGLISQRSRLFIALEPRRSLWPRFCSRLLGAIGCNHVTRHDAVVSVRAGFSGHELSALWPDQSHWQLTEQPAGAFSQLFIARKNG